MSNSIQIFVVSHKMSKFPIDPIYKSILVGNNNLQEKYHFDYTDSSGDNISDKNSSYCELTALYWMWKNIKKTKIIGLTHYRRFFFNNRFQKRIGDVIKKDDIEKILDNYDIIVPEKLLIKKHTVFGQYAEIHDGNDMVKVRNIISNKYPGYLEAFDTVMNNKWLYSYNMFISKKTLIDNYCDWLFCILFELEKNINVSKYDKYNRRVFGFLAERLFTVWVLKNKLNVYETPVNNLDENLLLVNLKNAIKKKVIKYD